MFAILSIVIRISYIRIQRINLHFPCSQYVVHKNSDFYENRKKATACK